MLETCSCTGYLQNGGLCCQYASNTVGITTTSDTTANVTWWWYPTESFKERGNMHKALLKGVISKAFFVVDTAIDLVRFAYGVVDRSGGAVLDEIDGASRKLREVMDKAVDELPG
jgi:hypothetical protein